MTSATGEFWRTRSRAFTLLEVLLVLALIGLVGGALIAGAGFLSREGPPTAEEALSRAISGARRHAMATNQEVRLSFDREKKAFRAFTDEGERSFPVPIPGELRIEFLPPRGTEGGGMLLGGALVETRELAYLTFYPDGTCSPFRAQVRTGGEPRVVEMDPWTCAQVLPEVPRT